MGTSNTSCSKGLFYFFNFIFWLSGAALLGIGVWLLVDQSTLSYVIRFLTEIDGLNYKTDSLDIVAYLFIAAGAFVFIVGLCGCCGAVRGSACMMGLYIFFLVLVMAVEIASGVLTVIYRYQLLDRFEENGSAYIKVQYAGNRQADYGLNFIQFNWKCCGVRGHNDYQHSRFSNSSSQPVSSFCCAMNSGYKFDERSPDARDQGICMTEASACMAHSCPDPSREVHKKACATAIEDWIKSNLPIFVGVGFGIGVFELIMIILTIVVCREIRTEN